MVAAGVVVVGRMEAFLSLFFVVLLVVVVLGVAGEMDSIDSMD